jgi:hypothetical protein
MNTSIIMSTDRPNKSSLELHKTRKEFEYYLSRTGATYEVCEGSWEGEREQSYMITLSPNVAFDTLKALAFTRYNQDAVLRVASYGGASLCFNDGTCDFIGKFVQVDAIPTDKCYTQSFKTGTIYVTQAN